MMIMMMKTIMNYMLSTAAGADYTLCTVEIFLVTSLCILLVQQVWEFIDDDDDDDDDDASQVWEFIALGRRYFLELESWFKMLIFSLVLTTMFFLGNPDVMSHL